MISDYYFEDADVADGAEVVCAQNWFSDKSPESGGRGFVVGKVYTMSIPPDEQYIAILNGRYNCQVGKRDILISEYSLATSTPDTKILIFVPKRALSDEMRTLLVLHGDYKKILV